MLTSAPNFFFFFIQQILTISIIFLLKQEKLLSVGQDDLIWNERQQLKVSDGGGH